MNLKILHIVLILLGQILYSCSEIEDSLDDIQKNEQVNNSIKENASEDLILFKEYLKREKYGDWPILENHQNRIFEAYSDYLDSIRREKAIYFKFAVLEDSLIMENLLRSYEDTTVMYFLPIKTPENSPNFVSDSIQTEVLNQFKMINNKKWGEIMKKLSPERESQQVYAITRPFLTSSVNYKYAVIQEFGLVQPIGCMSERQNYLIFNYSNGKWKLIDVL